MKAEPSIDCNDLAAHMPPHGRQGFASAADAIEDARAEIKVTDKGFLFAVMRKGDDFGWLLPVSYAERISKSNGVDIVSIEDLWLQP